MRQCPRQFDARHNGARSAVDLVASAEFEFGVGPERLTSLVHPITDGRVDQATGSTRLREES